MPSTSVCSVCTVYKWDETGMDMNSHIVRVWGSLFKSPMGNACFQTQQYWKSTSFWSPKSFAPVYNVMSNVAKLRMTHHTQSPLVKCTTNRSYQKWQTNCSQICLFFLIKPLSHPSTSWIATARASRFVWLVSWLSRWKNILNLKTILKLLPSNLLRPGTRQQLHPRISIARVYPQEKDIRTSYWT